MPNSIGTLSSGLVVQAALDLVFTKYPQLGMIATDFSDQQLDYNQSLTTRIPSVPTVGTFGDAATAHTTTDVAVTLNTHKQVFHTFTVAELSGTKRNLVQEAAEPIAVSIGKSMLDALAALWVIGNFTNKTVLANGWDYDHLVGVRTTMNKRGVPDYGRFYVANSDVYGSFLQDPTIVAAQNNPANANAIANGQLPVVAGMGITEFPDLPTTGNMVAFSGTKDTCVIVSRVQKDPRETTDAPYPGKYQVVTNAQSGLSVLVNEWIAPADNSVNVRISWMYGVAKGNINNGQLIISA